MKNRNKIYNKKFLGISFPIKESDSSGVFEQTNDTLSLAKSRIYNLLFTAPGTRVMMPNFGVNIQNRLFEQNSKYDNDNLKMEIKDQITNNIPDIKIDNIDIEEIDNKVEISIWFSLIYDDTINDSIVITY